MMRMPMERSEWGYCTA